MDAEETAFAALDALDDLPRVSPELVAWTHEAAAINAEAVERRRTGRGLAFASCLLLLATSAAGQENKQPKIDVNGGLQAQLVTIARQGQWTITAQVRLTNTSPNTAFILIIGIPTAVDDAGMTYGMLQGTGVSGFAFCRGPAETKAQPHTVSFPQRITWDLFSPCRATRKSTPANRPW